MGGGEGMRTISVMMSSQRWGEEGASGRCSCADAQLLTLGLARSHAARSSSVMLRSRSRSTISFSIFSFSSLQVTSKIGKLSGMELKGREATPRLFPQPPPNAHPHIDRRDLKQRLPPLPSPPGRPPPICSSLLMHTNTRCFPFSPSPTCPS